MRRSDILGLSLFAGSAAASFADPEVDYRPRFRYWLPDASVSTSIVQDDIATIADAGAGGIELIPYYQYGLAEAQNGVVPPTDWTKYGFGTKAFREVFKAALQACSDNNIIMDFAQGPNQGAGVPSIPGEVGLAVELAYANVTLGSGQTFDGTLPLSKQFDNPFSSFMHSPQDFGQQTLFAVQGIELLTQASHAVAGEGQFASNYELNHVGRVVDLTAKVGGNRSLNWTAPMGNSTWRIVAWYERYTNQKSCEGGLNATDFIGNGSWTVDHFSANGSRKVTNFLDEHVLSDPETKKLLASIGRHAWEDSMEMVSTLWWTPSLPRNFKRSRGYEITPCLPFLITPENSWSSAIVPYGEGFTAAKNTAFGDKCSQDYRTTLSEGYHEYLQAYVNWSHEQGILYSAQPAYNLPLEMLDNIATLDAPEGESLGFSNIIDTYRQFSGPAHLAGNSVISSECGAADGGPYQQTLPDLLWSVRRGLSTGISMHVLHGFAYSGRYTNTTWPSFTTFSYRYSDMWNNHQPSWIHMNDSLQYIARNQYISQSGKPSIDLAFYLYGAPWKAQKQYTDTNLEQFGYTYGYLSSGNLQTESAVVQNGVLAPDGPSYKALIFLHPDDITLDAAEKLHNFSEAGLPIFVIGGTNFSSIGQEPGASSEVSTTMSSLYSQENVHTLESSAELPAALHSAGILPKVSFASNTTSWYSFWRRAEDIEYAYIYNDGSSTESADVTFATDETRIPFYFNSWTGVITPVLQYRASTAGITIPITLASNQTTILGFALRNTSFDVPVAPPVHITSSKGALAGLNSSGSTVSAYLSGDASLTLSNASVVSLTASPPSSANLTSWDIVIEDWHRTADTYSMDTAISYHTYNNSSLAPWTELDDALVGVSGIGRYTTTFAYPNSTDSSDKLGALLNLGRVTNTIRAWVNGKVLPPIDIADAVVDVSELVRQGSNELVVEVTTTLFNRIKADGNTTWTYGVVANNEQNGAFYEANAPKPYGLLGPVSVQWVDIVDVA